MEAPRDGLQRLLDEAPFVQLLAQALVADEADEVVQRTWLQAIRHGGGTVASPRAWLARVVHNVASNLRRGRRLRQRLEHSVRPEELVPSSAELMQHEEQRRLLVAAVDRLPEPLRAVVLLRWFEGLLPQAIAARLGVTVTTVWNQLRRALQLLRERLDAEHGGDRRAWLVPLVPFAGSGKTAAVGAAATTGVVIAGLGVMAMTMKAKLVAALVLVAACGALVLWSGHDPRPDGPTVDSSASGKTAVVTATLSAADAPAPATSGREAVANEGSPASTGSLEVHVRYEKDKVAAAGVTVIIGRNGADRRVDGWRQRTDALGTARFTALRPGRFAINCDREIHGHRVEVVAGANVTIDYDLPAGLHVRGIVVDAADAPVPGAIVEIAPSGLVGTVAEDLARTGPDGRFEVRTALESALVGARAEGSGPSALRLVLHRKGEPTEVRLVLGPPAGSVEGTVVDEHGKAIAGAVIQVGEGTSSGVSADSPPFPALVRSDGEGRFRAVGVLPGGRPVLVCAPGFAPWQGRIDVTAHLAVAMRIVLQAGGVIHGRVIDGKGGPAANAEVEVGNWQDLAHYRTVVDADGAFELVGLPLGDVVLSARHDDAGRVEQTERTVTGVATECELRLTRGIELRGRVVDPQGAPVAMAMLLGLAAGDGPQWHARARTAADGSFALANCPEGRSFQLQVHAGGFEPFGRAGVTPGSPLEVTLQRSVVQAATVRIRGVVLASDGTPVGSARVMANGKAPPSRERTSSTDASGRFELGPLPAGRWSVVVLSQDHPRYLSQPVEIGPDATHDFGVIQLAAGGQATAVVDGDRQDAKFYVSDAGGQVIGSMTEVNGSLVSQKLTAGVYRLVVNGKTTASMSIPFEIKAGETTPVAVTLAPGVSQRFEVMAKALVQRPDFALLEVRRGNDVVIAWNVALPPDRPGTVELCLPPGAFDAIVTVAGRELGRAPFVVAGSAAQPVRIDLR